MSNSTLIPIDGIIQNISTPTDDCCQQQVTIRNSQGVYNFIVDADTYIVGSIRLRPGMTVAAFYDGNVAVPLVYPPQYQAVIISRLSPGENIYAGYFPEDLVTEDQSLALNIGTSTEVVTANGQTFHCNPGGHMLIVYYSSTTRSLPPQTTPRKVIVLC